MLEVRNRRLLVDGKPTLLLCGEVHYFRLDRNDWEDRIVKAKECGCTVIASYIPWIVHEPSEGRFDLDGRSRPENDLGAFIDLCTAHGLLFVARPGPFIMAEMKNEGIPYWVYSKHPDAVPITWDGERARSKTLDYLHSGYLECCRRWYAAVMPVLAERLHPKGPVIAVQLDNEIGMLSWVNNQPDLTEDLLCDFSAWLANRYNARELQERYPFDLADPVARARAMRSPADAFALAFHRDYGAYSRSRISRYVARLRSFAEEAGVRDVPFLVNIHGTGGGNGRTFPIGIDQLREAYTQAPGYLSGSDHYFGELQRDNFQDLYTINAFMESVHLPDQPQTTLEFEVGTGDYGETGAVRQSGASADLKVKLSAVQGHRLLNYYLLAGGVNPLLPEPVGDGNDRIAFTGERHGFAAPLSPEGVCTERYHDLALTNRTVATLGPWLADMDEERDGLSIGFVSSYYRTDFHRDGPMRELVQSLEWIREPLQTLTRAMLFAGYRFGACDLEYADLDHRKTPALAVVLARNADATLQVKLAAYVRAGGRLLVYGDFPTMDMEGKPCRVLADALGVEPVGPLFATSDYHVSVQSSGWAKGPEVRVWRAFEFADHPGVFARYVGRPTVCGIETDVGSGKAVLLTCNHPCHMRLFRPMLARVAGVPAWQAGAPNEGVIVTSAANVAGERVLLLGNLDHELKPLALSHVGRPVLEGTTLPARRTVVLPFGMQIGGIRVLESPRELLEAGRDRIEFGTGLLGGAIRLDSDAPLHVQGATAHRDGNLWTLRPHADGQPVVVRKA